ncbi:MAG: coproporphyrinogen III oxidase [Pseudomonadota bacterium]
MNRVMANTQQAKLAVELIAGLQSYFVKQLNQLSKDFGEAKNFAAIEWFRNSGKNGGGVRYVSQDDTVFNRAQVNFSQVQYEVDSTKPLNSATAISTIIHPTNPHAPSMHMHISYSDLKNGTGYWRIMADLNPAIFYNEDAKSFKKTLEQNAQEYYQEGNNQGLKYFYIPVLERHRGVEHFYLEGFNSGDNKKDSILARGMGEAVIDTYIAIVRKRIETPISDADRATQRAYHSLYLLQVLTLDRGTTSGLLVHNENDVGILGSIPAYIDTELLRSWIAKMPAPQDKLLSALCATLGEAIVYVEDKMKQQLGDVLRKHYTTYPQALSMQASGNIIPPTVQNHK